MEEFKLIVAGGRDFNDYEKLNNEINRLLVNQLKNYDVHIVSGAASGADGLAIKYAALNNKQLWTFPANWDQFGKSAGYKRNVQMAEFSNGLLAFWDGQSKGTKHMIDIARRHGLSVRVIRY